MSLMDDQGIEKEPPDIEDRQTDQAEQQATSQPNLRTTIAVTKVWREVTTVSVPVPEIIDLLVAKGWQKPTGHFHVAVDQSKAGIPVLRLTQVTETPEDSTVYDAGLKSGQIIELEP